MIGSSMRSQTAAATAGVITVTAMMALVLNATIALAQEASPSSSAVLPAQPSAETPSTYDRIWKFTEWYVDDTNPVVQKVLFSGRYQHDFAVLDADQGDLDEWNVRRMRLGPKVTLFRSFVLHAEAELNPQERDPVYVRFTDLYLQWSRDSRLVLTAGKHGVPFTMDGATSSKELLAIDRSSLSNNIWFPQEYIPGFSANGKVSRWTYRGGIYSSGAANRELGEFSGGVFTLGVVGYDFATSLGAKEALLSANYVYQDPDPDNTFTRRLDHVLSVNFKLERARWGLRSDLSTASGYQGQSDLRALMVMPFANLTEKVQVVGRYTVVDSEGPNGVALGTYENRLVGGRGDLYREGYVGLNYYFYGHRLKLQSGLQLADMNDDAGDGGEYSGVAWTTGLRVGW